MFVELARAGSQALHGLGVAATEVLRHADFSVTEDDHQLGTADNLYRNGPHGDGRDGPRAYLNPHDTHNVHE
tara:strand:- start:12670 stop:12885 length:216 start_codon:yes stop_codon:yes gene_type:complete